MIGGVVGSTAFLICWGIISLAAFSYVVWVYVLIMLDYRADIKRYRIYFEEYERGRNQHTSG